MYQVSWVKSPYLMCPPNGLTAFGTRATNLPPGRSAAATASKVASTSGLVRCSSRSVAVTAASSAWMLPQQLTVVAEADLREAGGAGQRDLLRADVDAGGVVAVG